MLKVTYRNRAGAARQIAIPEIEGVSKRVMIGSVVSQAMEDAGPVSFIRLVTDTEALAEAPQAPLIEGGEDAPPAEQPPAEDAPPAEQPPAEDAPPAEQPPAAAAPPAYPPSGRRHG